MHVTSHDAWSLIRYEGLRHGERNHIHFVTRAPQNDEVVAGVRRRGEVCVFVDVGAAMRDGMKFLIAPSQVIVTTGNAEGIIPSKYILKAVDKETGIQLYPPTSKEVLRAPKGTQYVNVNSLHAFDNEYAYFTWTQFGPQAQDIMMLIDTGASI